MSKYKVGDKVILEGQVDDINDKYTLNVGVKFKNNTIVYFEDKYLSKNDLSKNNKTYEDGLNDAWELVEKILEMPIGEREMALSIDEHYLEDILVRLKPQEALKRLEAYEESKAIKVGDVVYADDEPDSFGVVTWKQGNGVYVMWDDGSCGDETNIDELHKTGRHIDISSILEQIRGNE